MGGKSEAHRVDQAVVLVAGLEVDLAADRRHPDRVAVVADPADGVLEQVARASRLRHLAEAQRVEHRDRSGADGEHVAQDPTDAGRGALEGLDRARVVVGLDLERDPEPAADVDDAGVLAGPHEHGRTLGRQPAQELAGVLVGAVLRPHQRQHRQLRVAGVATEEPDDQRVLGVGEPECPMAAPGPERGVVLRRGCSRHSERGSTERSPVRRPNRRRARRRHARDGA